MTRNLPEAKYNARGLQLPSDPQTKEKAQLH